MSWYEQGDFLSAAVGDLRQVTWRGMEGIAYQKVASQCLESHASN